MSIGGNGKSHRRCRLAPFALNVFELKPFYEARKFVLSLLLRQELIETNTCKKSVSGPFIR